MILIDDRNAGQHAGESARASRDDRAGAVSTMLALKGRARSQQALAAVVVVLSLAVWFSATAVVPTIQVQWGITVTEAVWLTAAVQIGFVLGAVVSAFTNLADRIAPHVLLGASAAGAAIVTAILALFVDSLAVAIPLRLVTGMFMAGVYPLGMKLMVSWSTTERRGSSLGLLIGALTLGSALPHLIGVLPIDWRWLMFASAMTTLAGAVIALAFIRPGPQLEHRSKPNARYVISMFRDPRQRLINLGYFGHMWELYAMWAWLPTFVIASHSVHSSVAPGEVSLIVFLSIGVAGVVGCLAGGWLSDRFGRPRTATAALLVSGLCCLASPAAFLLPGVVLVVFAVVWGASVIADSGIFSTLLADAADPRYVGTALTAQTAIGFLVTVITIQLTPVVAGWVGWQFAFLLLGVGPIVGVLAMKILRQHNTTSKETTV